MKKDNWLLDGFPRTVPQCKALMAEVPLTVVLNLDVPFEEIISRVKGAFIAFTKIDHCICS